MLAIMLMTDGSVRNFELRDDLDEHEQNTVKEILGQSEIVESVMIVSHMPADRFEAPTHKKIG